jgi:ABC-2 type transport system permease protein
MLELLKIELFKIFRRPRTYISFVGVAALTFLFQMVFLSDGEAYINFGMGSLSSVDLGGKVLNGYLVCYIILQTLLLQVPLLVAFVTGDAISGEGNMGTLRLLVSKPISRWQIIMAKYLAGILYIVILLIFLAMIALFLSMAIFDTGDLTVLKSEEVQILDSHDVFWRYICAFLYAALALSTVAAIGLFLSVMADNSVGPIVATMVIVIFFTVISSIDTPLFKHINPYLFTSKMVGWKGFFYMKTDEEGQPIVGSISNLPKILKDAGILLTYIVLLIGGAIYLFKKKDILS